jgi:hypothetical protein
MLIHPRRMASIRIVCGNRITLKNAASDMGVAFVPPQIIANFSLSLVATNASDWNNVDEVTYRIYATEAEAEMFEYQAEQGGDAAQMAVGGGSVFPTTLNHSNEKQPFAHCLKTVLQAQKLDWARCFVRDGADVVIVTLATPHQGPWTRRRRRPPAWPQTPEIWLSMRRGRSKHLRWQAPRRLDGLLQLSRTP